MRHRTLFLFVTWLLVVQKVNYSSGSPVPEEPKILYRISQNAGTSNERNETIAFKSPGTAQEELVVKGSYMIYYLENGSALRITYTADRNGYVVHYTYELLPPPPLSISPAGLKSSVG